MIIFSITETTYQVQITKQQYDEQQILELCTEIEKHYYTTTNNVTKTIDTHDKQKDLGVTFDSKLTFDEHISQVVNKITKMTHYYFPLYKTMVRSHLDYAMAVWHPYKIKHKIALENIQRRATKELPGTRDLSYIYRRLKLLNLPTLAYIED